MRTVMDDPSEIADPVAEAWRGPAPCPHHWYRRVSINGKTTCMWCGPLNEGTVTDPATAAASQVATGGPEAGNTEAMLRLTPSRHATARSATNGGRNTRRRHVMRAEQIKQMAAEIADSLAEDLEISDPNGPMCCAPSTVRAAVAILRAVAGGEVITITRQKTPMKSFDTLDPSWTGGDFTESDALVIQGGSSND